MMSLRLLVVALLAAAAPIACGGDDDDGGGGGADAGPDAASGGDIADRLRALPGVMTVDEKQPTLGDDYRYFEIAFDQPVDHDDPEGQHFTQHLTLVHRGEHEPFVLATTGYGNYYGEHAMEPTDLLQANQLIIEHRYFLPSRPDPTDWNFLRVTQGAADHHDIAQSFHAIYDGPWVSTGGSKGGMTSIYHRYFYPDDVDATIAYVAPYNQGAGDARYDAWFDDTLPADCLAAVRAAQVDFLQNRRDALVAKATAEAEATSTQYTRVSIPAAVESAIEGVEWTFFQYTGVSGCDAIPGADATDDQAWAWLAEINHPDGLSDDSLAFFDPYVYQSEAELGYPATTDEHLEGLLQFGDADYAGAEPPEMPGAYDPSVVDAAAAWVTADSSKILFIYGQFDPWTAGAYDLGSNEEDTSYTVQRGTHNSEIFDLPAEQQTAAISLIERWTGAQVRPPSLRASWFRFRPREPHPPLRAWEMARRARLGAPR
ncbi:MAG TPA: S28 family serine protease [Kofleriaceae bacterium]|nr:S28 family serine protease [Kofleriaceae bacterium]